MNPNKTDLQNKIEELRQSLQLENARRDKNSCKFPLCNNKYPSSNKKFHKFPRDPGLSRLWQAVCEIPDEKNCSNYFVCNDHFVNTDFINVLKSRLNPKVLPKPALTEHITDKEIDKFNVLVKLQQLLNYNEEPITYCDQTSIPVPKGYSVTKIAFDTLNKSRTPSVLLDNSSNQQQPEIIDLTDSESNSSQPKVVDNGSTSPQIEIVYCEADSPQPEPNTDKIECKYPNCTNNKESSTGDIVFHKLPEDKETALMWKRICKIQSNDSDSSIYVCEEHFLPNDYTCRETKELHCEAIPIPVKYSLNKRLKRSN